MFLLVTMLMSQLFGVQIHNPDPDKIIIVRTDQEPPQNHHPILDDPRFAHLLPFTVTIKTTDKAIHTITVVFDVVDQDGVSHSYGRVFTMPPGGMVIGRHDSCAFWPGGRMPKDIPGRPLMSVDPIDLEHARSVTFSIDYIQFEDGSTAGPNARNTPKNLADYERLRNAERLRRQK